MTQSSLPPELLGSPEYQLVKVAAWLLDSQTKVPSLSMSESPNHKLWSLPVLVLAFMMAVALASLSISASLLLYLRHSLRAWDQLSLVGAKYRHIPWKEEKGPGQARATLSGLSEARGSGRERRKRAYLHTLRYRRLFEHRVSFHYPKSLASTWVFLDEWPTPCMQLPVRTGQRSGRGWSRQGRPCHWCRCHSSQCRAQLSSLGNILIHSAKH